MHQLLHWFSHAGTKGGSLPLSRLVPYMNIQIGSRWFLWSGLGSPSTCLPDFKPILRHTWLSSSWEPWWSSYALATHDILSTTRSSLRMLGELESAKWAFRWRKFAQLMSYSHECVNWLTSLFSDPKAPLINLVARDLPTLRHIVGSFFKADGLDDRVMPMPHDNLRSSSSFQVWWAKVNEFDPFICF